MPGGWWYGQPWCEQCDRTFVNEQAIRNHFQSSARHDWCARCDRDFNSPSALQSHLVNSTAHAFCTLCNSDFNYREDLEEHYEQQHFKCSECSTVFSTDEGLHQHSAQSHPYCGPCRRVFHSQQNLQAHLGSSVHTPLDFPCPSVQFGSGCPRLFVSQAAAVAHLEAGTCSSGMTRRKLDQLVVQNDRYHLITNPNQRLIGYDNSQSNALATSGSYNHYLQRYECLLCSSSGAPKLFNSLNGLNQHLASPKHASGYGDNRLYRCPKQGCGGEFWTLSGLVQHVESSSCGARSFTQQVMSAMNGGMRSIGY